MNPISLSAEQQRALLQHWSDDLSSLYDFGAAIYMEIFRLLPTAARLFNTVTVTTDGEIVVLEDKRFREQALRFVQVIGLCVHNLHHLEECAESMLIELGFRHRDFIDRGLKIEYFDVFSGAIVNIVRRGFQHDCISDAESQLVVEAWNLLAVYITQKIKQGFLLDQLPGSNARRYTM